MAVCACGLCLQVLEVWWAWGHGRRHARVADSTGGLVACTRCVIMCRDPKVEQRSSKLIGNKQLPATVELFETDGLRASELAQ